MIIKKAGCILIDCDKKKIALVYRKEQKDYTFPKGHLEEGETLEECAIRETEEETGRICIIDNSKELPILTYKNKNNNIVEIKFFIGIDKNKTDQIFEDNLIHNLEWFYIEKIEEKITYKNLCQYWKKIKPIVDEILNNK